MARFVPINYCPRCGAKIEPRAAFGQVRPVCPACGYVHFYDPKVAAAVFIEREGRVLLIKRGVEPERGKWALPAGFIDRGEDPRHTAAREVHEETGLAVELTRLVDVYYEDVDEGANIIIIYAAAVIGGTPRPQDDAVAVGWFGPDDLPLDELAFASTRRLIDGWLNGRGD